MKKHKQELLLFAAAAVICAVILLYNVFDSPKYSRIEPPVPSETVTQAQLSGAVNVNTASADELTELYGIGKARAEAIIKYREENGRFVSLDELMNVDGISQAVIDRNRDKIIF